MKLSRTLLGAIIANEVRGLVCASLLALAMCHGAHAQNAPLSGLPQRGTVQGTDIIPIMPAAGPQLEQTTVLSLASVLGASGGGLVASVTLSVPTYTCPTTGSGALVITCTANNQSANAVYAGPASGGAAAPGFRALTAADVPAVNCSALPALTGDVTSSACATTLAASGVTAGSYGSAFAVPVLTFDAKGRATSAATAAIQGATGAPIGTGGTLYVNAGTGSDSNTCLASGAACKTIAHALSLIPPVSAGAVYTVNVADGTYSEGLCLHYPFTTFQPPNYPSLDIVGDTAAPANVVLTGSCQSGGISLYAPGSISAQVEGITFNPGTAVAWGLQMGAGAIVTLNDVTFENAATGMGIFHGGRLFLENNITVSGFTSSGIFASTAADVSNSGSLTLVMTASGTATQCLHADGVSEIQFDPASDVGQNWTGSVSCPGGASSVTWFANSSGQSVIEINGFPITANNSTTPASSIFLTLSANGTIGVDGSISTTVANFTNECVAWETGTVRMSNGSGNRHYTNVGGDVTGAGGQCHIY